MTQISIPFDWGFRVFPAMTTLIFFALNFYVLVKVKFNDLKHIGISLEEIKKKFEEQDIKIDKLAVDVAFLKGKFSSKRK